MNLVFSYTNEQINDVFMRSQRELAGRFAKLVFDEHKLKPNDEGDMFIHCSDGRILPFNPFIDLEDAAFIKETMEPLFSDEERLCATLAYLNYVGFVHTISHGTSKGCEELHAAKKAGKTVAELMPLTKDMSTFLQATIYPLALLTSVTDFDERVAKKQERDQQRQLKQMLEFLSARNEPLN